MNAQKKNNEKGFTIIEVVLVLAIAALIFLMVFIALPALQRSQRDTQRKNDISRVMTAIQNYQSNNRNKLPANSELTGGGFIQDYLAVNGETFTDPNGDNYSFRNASNPTSFSTRIFFTKNATCDGEKVDTGKGAQKIALQYKLEGGGVICESN